MLLLLLGAAVDVGLGAFGSAGASAKAAELLCRALPAAVFATDWCAGVAAGNVPSVRVAYLGPPPKPADGIVGDRRKLPSKAAPAERANGTLMAGGGAVVIFCCRPHPAALAATALLLVLLPNAILFEKKEEACKAILR